MARKRKPKVKDPRRREQQRVKDRLAHAQDDAQQLGVIETTPEELLKPARVDPSVQTQQRFPGLIGTAIRRGWAVPEERKPGYVDELATVLEDPDATAMAKVFAFNALVKGDQVQHEKDQQYIRLDRVIEMWRGMLAAVRNRVTDPALVRAIVDDVLLFMPPSAGGLETVDSVNGVIDLE